MNARWQDTPVAVLLRLLADLMIVNLLALACSIPLFTIGASLSAMYAVLFRRERDEGMVSVLKTYFHAFVHNFPKATVLELVVVAVVIVAAGDFRFAMDSQQPLRSIYLVVGTIMVIIGLIQFILAFAQQSTYQNSLAGYLKNSFILAACAPGQLLLSLLIWIVPWLLAFTVSDLFLELGVLYLLWGFSFPAWVTVKLMYRVFQKTKQADDS